MEVRIVRIKNVINNNILCAIDEKGKEMIVTGKGIGFKRKRGEFIDETQIQKVYFMEDKAEQKKLRELVQQIPIEHLELTQQLISMIREQLRKKLNESLLITLADHISFAIRRKEEGIAFSNPLAGSIMCYYPQEYHLGQQCLKIIREQCGCDLPKDEAAFIALHIVNAELNTSMSEIYDITHLIEGAIQVVECFYQKQFDRESLNFDRFCVHLRYFAQRLFQDRILSDDGDEHDQLFRKLIVRNSKEHYKCAQCIGEFIRNTYKKELTEEELIYLTIHLRRINSSEDDET